MRQSMYAGYSRHINFAPRQVIERALTRMDGIVATSYFRFRYTSSIPQIARAELAHMVRDGINLPVLLRDLRV
jgi:hypothetical protein